MWVEPASTHFPPASTHFPFSSGKFLCFTSLNYTQETWILASATFPGIECHPVVQRWEISGSPSHLFIRPGWSSFLNFLSSEKGEGRGKPVLVGNNKKSCADYGNENDSQVQTLDEQWSLTGDLGPVTHTQPNPPEKVETVLRSFRKGRVQLCS